jgi:arsenate reductase (thioredoxin)
MKTKVLFLCTGNSCRSQMAEGLLREMAGDRFEALSAGMEPATGIFPPAIEVMAEIGIDISGQRPKGIEKFLGIEWIKWLIVVCNTANNTCPRIWPLLPEKNRVYWPLDDPAAVQGSDEEKREACRHVRDEIRLMIGDWLKQTTG